MKATATLAEESMRRQEALPPAARLGLGTVQFGLDYGLPASGGQVAEADVGILLRDAYDAGIRLLDTAERYGEAEEVLGRALPGTGEFRIVTKTPVVADAEVSAGDARMFKDALDGSRRRLGVQSLDGVLVHAASDILKPGGERLIDALYHCRDAGWVRRVGVSVYDAAEIDGVLERFTPDIVQLPFSIVDTRLLRSGHLSALKSLNVEIHARSLFLQGVLLQEPDQLPDFFAPIRGGLEGFGRYVAEIGKNRLAACLAFGFQQPELDHLVIGVKERTQLLAAVKAMEDAASRDTGIDGWNLDDVSVLDPRQWPAALQGHRKSE